MAHKPNITVWRVIFNRLKRKFIKNPVDEHFEQLALLLEKDSNGKEMWKNEGKTELLGLLLKHIYELEGIRRLYFNLIIPETRKMIKSLNRHSEKSFYFKVIDKKIRYDEELAEVVRMGYVQLYHKFENYRDSLIPMLNQVLSEAYKSSIDLSAYLFENFKYKILDIKNLHPNLQKINWISNCVKHKNGKPLKQPVPKEFKQADASKKIAASPEMFQEDLIFMMDYFSKLFTGYMAVGHAHFAHLNAAKSDQVSEEARRELHIAVLMQLLCLAGRLDEPRESKVADSSMPINNADS